MEGMTTFSSDKESLVDLLSSIRKGKTQLPDFQRGWVWDDDHIRSLLASVSLSYPIGAVMMLEAGGEGIRFKTRTLESVSIAAPVRPDRLILDGQQRLTALYQSLYSGQAVLTRDARGYPICRWYYLDIGKALSPNGDREEAVVALPEDRRRRNFRGEVEADYSTRQLECKGELFPVAVLLDIQAFTDWQLAYLQAEPSEMQARLLRWNDFLQNILQRVQQYQIPLIVLKKDTPKQAVCQVFEKVNTGGVSLNVFELLTATYAADNFLLRDDWELREKRLRKHLILRTIANTDFLQAISLLASRERRLQAIGSGTAADNAPGISCKRKDILDLSLQDYRKWADPVTAGFERAVRLLLGQGIFDARDIPYRTQLTPLAAILTMLGDRADNDGVRSKLAQWFWCGVFGELYGGAIETRFAKDVPEVLDWINGGPGPSTISDANFAPARLLTLRTRNSAAYKGISALLLKDGGLDLRTGDPITVQTYFDDKIDIHHIFPQEWCRRNKIPDKQCDCIVNKTPLAARTNRQIGGNAPSVYLARLQKAAGTDDQRMKQILASHVIDAGALRAEDFNAFFAAREAALLARIEHAIGKQVLRDLGQPYPDEEMPGDDEDELAVAESDEPGESEEDLIPTVDRSYWEQRARKTIRIVDQCLDILQEVENRVSLNYRKGFIGLTLSGKTRNFVTFCPKRWFVRVAARVGDRQTWVQTLEAAGMDVLAGVYKISIDF
jgi:hypothetical protein